jgi:hypothetical protein
MQRSDELWIDHTAFDFEKDKKATSLTLWLWDEFEEEYEVIRFERKPKELGSIVRLDVTIKTKE